MELELLPSVPLDSLVGLTAGEDDLDDSVFFLFI